MPATLSFSAWLKRRRRAMDLTQQQLAQRAYCSTVTVKRFEAGDLRPSKQLAELIGAALGVPPPNRERFARFARQADALATLDEFDAAPDGPASGGRAPLAFRAPSPLTRFIGREAESSAVAELLTARRVRLVTLTGPPGTGKTRLAVHVATRMQDRFRSGACVVRLESARDVDGVTAAIGDALDVGSPERPTDVAALRAWLRDKHLLLVLDNFEQALGARSLVSELLAAAPELSALVTSREPLGVYGEHEFVVSPLPLPAESQLDAPTALADVASVALFVDRALAVLPAFQLDERTGPSVARICAWLDGLPLAIEMAAARARHEPPHVILNQIRTRLDALSLNARDIPERQRTLRAAIAWSYELLSPAEQAVFDALGAFEGSATHAALAAVAGFEAAEAAYALIDKSLASAQPGTLGDRIGMLPTLREYAVERLRLSGCEVGARERHARHFLAVAREHGEAPAGPDLARHLAVLTEEHDNIRAALGFALGAAPRTLALRADGVRLAQAMTRFWSNRGHLADLRRWLDAATRVVEAEPDLPLTTAERARLSVATGRMRQQQADITGARAHFSRAAELYAQLGDEAANARARQWLAVAAMAESRFAEAASELERVVAVMRDRGTPADVRSALNAWAVLLVERTDGAADPRRAVALLNECLAISRALGDDDGVSRTLTNLGAAYTAFDPAMAKRALTEALGLTRGLGNELLLADVHDNFGDLAMAEEDFDGAERHFRQSLLIARDLGELTGVIECLERLTLLAAAQLNDADAAQLAGQLARHLEATGHGPAPRDPRVRAMLDGTRLRLGEARFQRAFAAGYGPRSST